MHLSNFTLDFFIFLFGVHYSITKVQVNEFFMYHVTSVAVEMAAQKSAVKAFSVVHCAMICDRMIDFCHSFAFNSTEKRCTPGSWILPSTSPNLSLGLVYYSKGFFCDPSQGRKALVNGTTNACVFQSDTTVNYTQARSNCKELGGSLFTVKTKDKKYLFLNYVKNLPDDVWIGLDDIVEEGVFRWADDNSTLNISFALFAPGEPNDFKGQDCAYYSKTYLFDDQACDSHFNFLCEFY